MSTGSALDAGDVPAFVELPDGLDDMAPGPRLSAVLAGLDPVQHTGHQLAVLLGARYRQLCYEQAQLLATVRELAYAPAGMAGMAAPIRDTRQNPFTSVEMSFAVTWTEYTSAQMVALAMLTVDEVPALGQALAAGRIDLDKAKVIERELGLICEVEQMREIVAAVLPEAPFETTAQLRARIRRIILKVNPEAVRERHKKAVEERRVEHQEYANGTAGLFASFLPKDKAAAAWQHVDAIARATRSGGDRLGRSLDQLRADVFADLLAGVDPTRAGAASPAARQGTINLHIDLTTLACLADQAGEIDGFGPVIADIARQAATQLGQISAWRFTVTDEGEVLAEGPIGRAAGRGLAEHLTRMAADADAGEDGRARYQPTQAQQNFIRTRDRTCRAPGCRRTAMRCEIDHNLDWAHRGPTLIDSMCCLCKRHHRAKHVGNFTVRRGPFGVEWQTPMGLRYSVIPEVKYLPTTMEFRISQTIQGHHNSKLRR
jgi:hypothetical protein